MMLDLAKAWKLIECILSFFLPVTGLWNSWLSNWPCGKNVLCLKLTKLETVGCSFGSGVGTISGHLQIWWDPLGDKWFLHIGQRIGINIAQPMGLLSLPPCLPQHNVFWLPITTQMTGVALLTMNGPQQLPICLCRIYIGYYLCPRTSS